MIGVHKSWGLNAYVLDRARIPAGLGYLAFAVDMYADGKATTHTDQAGACMTELTANATAWP
ncbi:MAG: dienelactone hydrolase family protein, partial [Gammaproteobacteria bacterium]|nr:dienelactone hydrolase family protein [Gammaproteobacteria bacterium]